jgi:mannose-6-phosphate isomerase-like protein (cupin superfamily)
MYYDGAPPIDSDLSGLLAANPIPAGANIHAVELGRTDSVSHHLVQIRDREEAHIHQHHDLTVVVLRGTGEVAVGPERVAVRSGDAIFVPRGTVHFFRNTGAEPAVALVTASPPLDRAGTEPVRP